MGDDALPTIVRPDLLNGSGRPDKYSPWPYRRAAGTLCQAANTIADNPFLVATRHL